MIKPFTFYLIIIIICTSFFSSTLGVSTISIHNEEMVGLPLLRSSESSYINQPEVSDPVVTESISKITGRIQVSIFDYKTSKALSAAVVTIYQITEKGQVKIATGETDSSGFYEATGIAHGNYNVTVEKATYQSESKLVILRTDYDRIIVNIYLSKAPLNSGYIEVYGLIANTKIPLKGAKVALYDATGILITSMVLNDVGFANITKLAVNKYILYISLKGYVSQKKEVAIDFIGDSEKVKFYLEPVGSGNGFIEVSVSDVVRNALSGAQVTIYNSSMDIIDAQKTNKVGFVNVTNLELGTYNVSVSLSGFSSHFQITEIDYPGDGDRLYFTLLESTGNGFILGQVMTESGEPILNAAVEVHSAKKILLYTLSTDTDGIFNVTDLIIGQTYYIFVSKDGYVSDYAIVKLEVIGFARVAIFLVKELGNDGFFELYVKNSTYFLADAYVEVYNAAGTLLNSYFTDTNGFINITNLVVGLYHFYILKDGYLVERTSGMISFDGDSDVITIILRNEPTSLPATGIIDVYVKDEDDLPIKGAYVRVVGEIAYSGYTGEKGEYSVKELYLGLYNITVSMKGYSDGTASTRIDYVGDRDRVYITLYPEETTSIRLYTSIPGKLDQIGGSYVRYKLDDGSFSKWFLTDESGQFEISNAKIGTYTIEILRGGFELQTQTVAVSEIGVIINAGTVLDIHAADGVTDYYALIVAGQIDRRFTIDAFAMYAILQNYYGFSS
ncbi:MAG: carboxypeptidase regulatory-like domain-containing protein, partial [Promethearchaeota archaeon]